MLVCFIQKLSDYISGIHFTSLPSVTILPSIFVTIYEVLILIPFILFMLKKFEQAFRLKYTIENVISGFETEIFST